MQGSILTQRQGDCEVMDSVMDSDIETINIGIAYAGPGGAALALALALAFLV